MKLITILFLNLFLYPNTEGSMTSLNGLLSFLEKGEPSQLKAPKQSCETTFASPTKDTSTSNNQGTEIQCQEKPSDSKLNEQLKQLQQVIRTGLNTKEPHCPLSDQLNAQIRRECEGTKKSSFFNGNFDWHSSVHGYWSLLSMARTQSDTDEQKKLLAEILPNLESELIFLNKIDSTRIPENLHSAFELPYGQAWLLLLLHELELSAIQFRNETSSINKLRERTEEIVLEWLEKSDFPSNLNNQMLSRESRHYSWLMAYHLLQLSRPKNEKTRARMKSLEDKKINSPLLPKALKQELTFKAAFVSPIAMYDLINLASKDTRYSVSSKLSESPYRQNTEAISIFPKDASKNFGHGTGVALTSMLAFASSAKMNKLDCNYFFSAWNELVVRPELWKENFITGSHWIPQFMWLNIWTHASRP